MDDFESFEFIDYTTSGPWEKFIIQIEDCLKRWGLVHNSYGVFSPGAMPTSLLATTSDGLDLGLDERETNASRGEGNARPHSSSSSSSGDARARAQRSSHATRTKSTASSNVFQCKEVLTLDGVSYTLSYRYHPAKARMASGVERIDLDFMPTTLEGIEHHALHRWTALTHILVLTPTVPEDMLFSSVEVTTPSSTTIPTPAYNTANRTPGASSPLSSVIDLGSAKLLLSSFAIAFQNTGCNIPVFVPTGQSRNMTFTGLSIQPQLVGRGDELGLEETEEDQAIEVRFNTVLVPYPPAQYTNLSGILDLFIERMGLEEEEDFEESQSRRGSEDGGEQVSGYIHGIKEQIFVSGLFSYHLDNWYDEDWRQWVDPAAVKEASGNMRDSYDPSAGDLSVPTQGLPFGPVQDPLKSMQLVARFASAPSTVYLDSKNLTDMDASQANIWIMRATFKNDDYGVLSGILEDTISSWTLETASQVRHQDQASTKDQSYGSLLRKGARLIQGTIAMVDAGDVENILRALFETSTANADWVRAQRLATIRTKNDQGSNWSGGSKTHRLIPASELSLHFRYATTVPSHSFLWKMLQHLVDVVSPNSHISYPTSFLGFMKALWADVLKRFRLQWRKRELIPWVHIYGSEGNGSGAFPSEDADMEVDENGEQKPVAIDLRYNLLHQKLAMINCCIVRELVNEKERLNEEVSMPSPSVSMPSPSVSTHSSSTSTSPKDESDTLSATETSSTELGKATGLAEDDDLVATLEKAQVTSNSKPGSLLSRGAVEQLQDLVLLENGEPLMVPRLQEPGYMTEDMIQQQEDLFENLGSSPDGAKMRAQMQSSQLISDMEAFKAANPGCILGDFIRWHSPKDWDEDKKEMSARMADSGNFWQELWAKAGDVPAITQTPLFDHKAEAEKALLYLERLSASDLFVQLIPTICLLAYDTLVSHPMALLIRPVAESLKELAQVLTDFPWNEFQTSGGQIPTLDLKPILVKFREVEFVMGRGLALARKFPGQHSLVERILEENESVVEDGTERDCVYSLFTAGGFLQSFPKPSSREFVMETFDPTASSFVSSADMTGWHSRPLQRRMYACFRESEVRIVEAIAKDGMFM